MFSIRLVAFIVAIVAVCLAAISISFQAPEWLTISYFVEVFAYAIMLFAVIKMLYGNRGEKAFYVGQFVVLLGYFLCGPLQVHSSTAWSGVVRYLIDDDSMYEQRWMAIQILHTMVWLLVSAVAGVYAASLARSNQQQSIDDG